MPEGLEPGTGSIEAPPQVPEALITAEAADGLIEARGEREQALLAAQERLYQSSREELRSRYRVEEGNQLTGFIRNCKAFFAGEYADLESSRRIAELDPTEQQRELDKAFKLFSEDGARRLGKIGVKTAVSGGIGAGVTALLGGTLLSPIFFSALAGGAVARGAFELYRHFRTDEREGRTELVAQRATVFAEAAGLQDRAGALIRELGTASDDRRSEIDQELNALHQYLIDLLHYESHKNPTEEIDADRALAGLARTNQLGYEKMQLEKKREKISDLLTMGGSLLGGLVGQAVQSSLSTVAEHSAQAHGVTADFDKDGISHFVEKISPSDIAGADPSFAKQLADSGGFVFHYTAQESAQGLMNNATTAILKDGSVVHVLPGMTPSHFSDLLGAISGESAKAVLARAGSLWKEALPLAAANLLFMAEGFGRFRKEESKSAATQPYELDAAVTEEPSPEVDPPPAFDYSPATTDLSGNKTSLPEDPSQEETPKNELTSQEKEHQSVEQALQGLQGTVRDILGLSLSATDLEASGIRYRTKENDDKTHSLSMAVKLDQHKTFIIGFKYSGDSVGSIKDLTIGEVANDKPSSVQRLPITADQIEGVETILKERLSRLSSIEAGNEQEAPEKNDLVNKAEEESLSLAKFLESHGSDREPADFTNGSLVTFDKSSDDREKEAVLQKIKTGLGVKKLQNAYIGALIFKGGKARIELSHFTEDYQEKKVTVDLGDLLKVIK